MGALTLRLRYNSTRTVRPNDFSPHMQQFTAATLRHLYDMSRDFTDTKAKRRSSVACVRTSIFFFLPGDQPYVHLTLRLPIRYIPGFNIHQGKMGTFCRIC